MNLQSSYDALEKISEENLILQNSSEMFIGKTIKVLTSLNPRNIYTWLWNSLKNKLLYPKLLKSRNIKPLPFFYAKGEPLEIGKKVVVYSCVTNSYDSLNEPLIFDNLLDYYLISDKCSSKKTLWMHMGIPENAKKFSGGMINRFCKLNPWDLFDIYDFSIYIDGNIQIVSDVRNLCSIAKKSKIGIAMHMHNKRDCIYNESYVCKLYKKGKIEAIAKQMEKYRQEGFPEHFGMVEATIIIVDLKNPIAKKIMSDWWNELASSDSGRDQLSFPYVLWKNGYSISDVGCLGTDRIKNPKFRTLLHHS